MKKLPFLSLCVAFVLGLAHKGYGEDEPSYGDKSLSEWVEALKDPDVSVRRQATQALTSMAPKAKAAVPALIEALKDSNPLIRISAAMGLGKLGPAAKEAIPTFIEMLGEWKDEGEGINFSRGSAVAFLVGMGQEAVQPLIKALASDNALVRGGAALALAGIGPGAKAAGPALTEAMKNQVAPVPEAARALAGILGPEAIPSLVEALKTDSPQVRLGVVAALAQLGPNAKAAGSALLEAMKDKDPTVSSQAAAALVKVLGDAALPGLLKALKDEDASVRDAAFRGLASLGPKAKTAVPALLEAVKDKTVSFDAASALVPILGSEEAVSVLTKLLADENAQVRLAAANAFAALGHQMAKPAVPALVQALNDGEPTVRAAAARSLGNLGRMIPEAKEAAPKLVPLLKDEDASVREAAVMALPSMGPVPKEAVPAFIERLKSDKVPVRISTITVLRSIRSEAKDAIPALTEALKDQDAAVRVHAAGALGAIDPQNAAGLSVLIEGLKDQHTRPLAAGNLYQMVELAKTAVPGFAEVLKPVLTEALKDQDAVVRMHVAGPLGAIDPQNEAALSVLIDALKDRGTRHRAAGYLGRMGESAKVAVPALTEALRTDDIHESSRVGILEALINIYSKAKLPVVELLIENLRSPNNSLRFAAAKGLVARGPESLPALTQALGGADPGMIESATWAMTEIAKAHPESKGTVQSAFKDALKSNNADLRFRAADGLLHFGGEIKNMVPVFAEALKDKDLDRRSCAVASLGSIARRGPGGKAEVKSAIPALIEALKDPFIRGQVSGVFGFMGPEAKEAAPAIKEMLVRTTDPQAQKDFGFALAPIDEKALEQAQAQCAVGPDLKAGVARLIEDVKGASDQKRSQAIWFLGQIGPAAKDAVPTLIEALKNAPNPDDVGRVVTVLGKIGPDAKDAVPALIEVVRARAVKPDDLWATKTALKALGQVVGPEAKAAVPMLSGFLQDANYEVRLTAAAALWRIDRQNSAAVASVVDTLDDVYGDELSMSLRTLGEMGPDATLAVPILIEMVKDKDWSYRGQAAKVLGEIGPDAKAAVPVLVRVLKEGGRPLGYEEFDAALWKIDPETAAKVAEELKDVKEGSYRSREEIDKALAQIRPEAKPSIDLLLESLKREDSSRIRAQAATTLAAMGPEANTAIPALMEALKDRKYSVRREAAKALGSMGPEAKSAVPFLVSTIQDGNGEVRIQAIGALGKIGPESAGEAIPALIAVLNGPHHNVRDVSDALQKLDPEGKAAFRKVAEDLRSDDESVRAGAVSTLLGMQLYEKAKPMVPALVEAMKDKSNRVRVLAARCLWSIDRQTAYNVIPDLLPALKDKDPDTRLKVMDFLSYLKTYPKLVGPLLVEALKDEDAQVRSMAASALPRLSPWPGTVPALTEALKDKEATVRSACACALGRIGPDAKSALPALIDALKDSSPDVRAEAAMALAGIGPGPEAVIEAMKDNEARVRQSAIGALGNLGPAAKDAVPVLLEALQNDAGRAKAAAEALGKIGPEAKAAVPALSEALKHKDPHFRVIAAQALWEVTGQTEPALKVVLEVLQDPEIRARASAGSPHVGIGPLAHLAPMIRARAAMALQKIAPESEANLQFLIEQLKDRSHETASRIYAASTLGKMGAKAKDAVPALTEAAKDPDRAVAAVAAQALANLARIRPQQPASAPQVSPENVQASPKDASATNNMRVLGTAAIEYIDRFGKGRYFPKTLAELWTSKLLTDSNLFICPLDDAPVEIHPGLKSSYLSAFDRAGFSLHDKTPSSLPMLWERKPFAEGRRRVCFFDTHVEVLDDAKSREVMDRLDDFIKQNRVQALIQALKEKDGNDRQQSVVALGKIGPEAKAAVPALVEGLKDQRIRRAAVNALGLIGPDAKEAIPALRELLNDPDESLRKAATDAIQRISTVSKPPAPGSTTGGSRVAQPQAQGTPDKSEVSTLIEALKDKNVRNRVQAMSNLAKMGPDAKLAVPALIDALKDQEIAVRSWAVVILGGIGPDAKEAIPALTGVMKETPPSLPNMPNVPLQAKWAHAKINAPSQASVAAAEEGPQRTTPVPAEERRVFVTKASAQLLQGDTVIATLRYGQELSASYVRGNFLLVTSSSNQSIGWVNKYDVGPKSPVSASVLQRFFRDPNPEKRREDVQKAIEALQSQDPNLRAQAAGLLDFFVATNKEAIKPAAPALVPLLKDNDVKMRVRAAGILKQTGVEPNDVPVLIEAMKDADLRVRTSAMGALGTTGAAAKEAVPSLIEAMKENDFFMRIAAVNALGQIGPDAKTAIPALTKAFKDEDASLRKAAEQALARINAPQQGQGTPASAAPTTSFEKGKKVFVAKEKSQLFVGSAEAFPLDVGQELEVIEVKGDWVGVRVNVGGEWKSGWIKRSDVRE